MSHLSTDLAHSLPEFILAAGILFLVLFGAIRGKDSDGPVTEIAAGLLGIAIVIILLGGKTTAVVFNGAFIDDGFGRFHESADACRIARHLGDEPGFFGA